MAVLAFAVAEAMAAANLTLVPKTEVRIWSKSRTFVSQ
jgi:hypothetical protein